MGAVFSMTVSVGGKGLTAVGANIFIHRFLSYTLWVSVPPFLSALLRTETLWLSAGYLRYRLSAFRADSRRLFRHFSAVDRDVVSAAEGLNGVSRNGQGFGYFRIAASGFSHFDYLCFLMVCHVRTTSSLSHEHEDGISEKTGKKIKPTEEKILDGLHIS